jgi:hypothetical protein
MPVQVVGSYDNLRYTSEHTYGYTVELWRQGDRILGLFSFTNGAQADFDTGTLDNLTFDPRTGAVTFESYAGMFGFEGTLTRNALSGRLSSAPRIGAPRDQHKEVVLRRSEEATALLRDYATFREWKQMAGEIVKRLGPKIVKE